MVAKADRSSCETGIVRHAVLLRRVPSVLGAPVGEEPERSRWCWKRLAMWSQCLSWGVAEQDVGRVMPLLPRRECWQGYSINVLSDQGVRFAQEGYQGRSPWLVRRKDSVIFCGIGRSRASGVDGCSRGLGDVAV